MIYLLDTSTMSDLMAADPRTSSRLRAVSPSDRVITCAIVKGEIQFGISRLAAGKRRAALEQTAADLLSRIPPEAVAAGAGDHYASVKLECEQAGTPMNDNDLWIASTALVLGATLVTRDNDFHLVPRLSQENWAY